jgi:hypothetical protein
MPKLSKEALNFRKELLGIGGATTITLVACLEKDLSATNQIIQLVYDKFNGNFNAESAVTLATAFQWILAGKPDDKEAKDKIWNDVVKAFTQNL